MMYQLEVCAYNIQSALIAAKVGADRVELCDSAAEGGTTPSYGVLKEVREKIPIQLYPIIRPRAGSFWYNEEEWAILKKDILLCKELGCDGISTGVQLQNGALDTEGLQRIVEWAYPMGVTCHRVFDVTPDPLQALEAAISAGCERILTSGQRSTAPSGAELLAKLVQQADERIIIMPGAGVRASNIGALATTTGAREFHTSAKIDMPERVGYRNPLVSDFGKVPLASEEELQKILAILNGLQPEE